MKNDEDAKHAINILETIPETILNITNEIVHYAKTVVGKSEIVENIQNIPFVREHIESLGKIPCF